MSDSNLSKHWQVVAIKEIAKVVTGTTPSTKNEQFWGGSIPFITPAELNGSYVRDTERKVTEQALKVSRPLPQGAVAVSCIGYIGKVGVVHSPVAVTNQQINSVIPVADKADSWFLAYLFQQIAPRLKDSAGVTTVPILNKSNFESFRISLPPLPEQRAIARALRAVQEAKEARQRELSLERERKAALMQHLFTHGTRGEARMQTQIGEMPESWRTVRLGDVTQVAYGLTVNQSRRSSSQLVPYLTVANVTRGALRLDEVKQIGMMKGDSESYCLRKGDVLLIEGNGNPRLLGSAAIWNEELPFALHQNHLIRARPNQTRVLPEWVMNYVNSDNGRIQLLGKAKTSSGLHSINSRLIANLLIPLPPLTEQRAVVDIIIACNLKVAALEKELTLLEELFKAMLEELVTGHLSAVPLIESKEFETSTAHT